MRSALFVVLMVLASAAPTLAQELVWAGQLGAQPWASAFLGEGPPAPIDAAKFVAVGPSGALYVAGEFQSQADFDMGPGSFVLQTDEVFDTEGFVTKATAAGEFLWARRFGGTDQVKIWGIAVGPSGQVTLVGHFNGTMDFDPGPGTFELSSTELSPFVVQLDTNGLFLWGLHFLAADASTATGLVADPSGNVYVCGGFDGMTDFDPGPGTNLQVPAGDRDAFLVKLDSLGQVEWVRTFGGPAYDSATELQLDPSGKLWVVGKFTGTVDLDPGPATEEGTSTGGTSDQFVSRFDSAGTFVSSLQYGGVGGTTSDELAVDAAGNLYVAGAFTNLIDFDPGPGTLWLTTDGGYDAYTLKIQPDGNAAWAVQLVGSQPALGVDLALDADGSVYNVGVITSSADFDPGPGELIVDPTTDHAYVWKLDTDANLVWVSLFGANSMHAEDVTLDSAGNVYAVGSFSWTSDFDPGPATSLLSAAFVDGYVLKLRQSEAAEWPGAVPDRAGPEQVPLTLAMEPDGSLTLQWNVACNAVDHAIAVGNLATLFGTGQYDHAPAVCSTGGAGMTTIDAAGDALYFLVVPHDGAFEGSSGKDSAGDLRPAASSPCYPRGIGTCSR